MGKKHKKNSTAASAKKKNAKNHQPRITHELPLPFPQSPNLALPKNDFLRDIVPYKESFQTALDTSYEGFAVDDGNIDVFQHESIRQALQVLEDVGFFRTDVTQPFGLGTKCAKTYVTRCLMGEEGTTYKYLGLRMFAFPWNAKEDHEKKKKKKKKKAKDNKGKSKMSLEEAVETIRQLNETLTERTSVHLTELKDKRSKRGASIHEGASQREKKFDITLINRMEYTDDLKPEPSMGQGKCSVSWHADSSLEHFSTIGVYHTLFRKDQDQRKKTVKQEESAKEWSVALRVAHNSEGPDASRRGMDIESSIVQETPPIAVSLPSGSAYYLLDDFNHHHQHAVLASNDKAATVRFSSTHRLLRTSHNVSYMIEQCRSVCSTFHKKGPKIWRSEQLVLTQLESEWLRQYYIQGKAHTDLLWPHWKESICALWKYWSQLEARTKQTIDLLTHAAQGRCAGAAPNGLSRSERKRLDKQKKACCTLEDLLSRGGAGDEGVSGHLALETIYEPFAGLLEERAMMREQWMTREKDQVFREVGRDCVPLRLPVRFNDTGELQRKDECGQSPMKGSPKELREIANHLRLLGKAFKTRDATDLPQSLDQATKKLSDSVSEERKSPEQGIDTRTSAEDEHSKTSSWAGWKQHDFGLELQSPWAEHLLEGRKAVETRLYDLPLDLLGKRVEIIKSSKGKSGVSSLGNIVHVDEKNGEGSSVVELAGWCRFTRVIKYDTREHFERDEEAHLVTRDSGYGWNDKTKVVYGWVVGEYHRYTKDNERLRPVSPVLVRRMRSFFELKARLPALGAGHSQSLEMGTKKRARAKKRKRGTNPKKSKGKKKRY